MYYVYVIQSEKFQRRYKGVSDNLSRRLAEHNSGKTKSTRAFCPWTLVYFEEFELFEEARARELYFKSAAGRRFLNEKIGVL